MRRTKAHLLEENGRLTLEMSSVLRQRDEWQMKYEKSVTELISIQKKVCETFSAERKPKNEEVPHVLH